jgi:signal transduction histidine kinase
MFMNFGIRSSLARLARVPRRWAIALAFVLAAVVGVFDYATGFDLHVTAFYLLPVCWATWAAGRKAGLSLTAACAALFWVAGVMTRHSAVPRWIPLWNTLMLLAIFVGAVYAIAAALDAYRSLAEAQASLRAANEHLEEMVKLRTDALKAEIAERQRQEQAKLQAERLLDRREKLATLGTLTTGIAHEIRNPLTSMKARLYTLNQHLQAVPAAREDAEILSTEIARLERIVRDALSFARPADPRLEPLAAGSLLREVQSLMAPELANRGVRLVVEPDSELGIRADSGHLKQVLINLVRNGAEAIVGAGTVTLRARAARVPLGGREADAVVLEVSDTGQGIPPEVEKRLFDPFFTTKDTGTGLGLPIAARIVEKHGGVLQYQTRPGEGTTFGVVLPRQAAAPGRSANPGE